LYEHHLPSGFRWRKDVSETSAKPSRITLKVETAYVSLRLVTLSGFRLNMEAEHVSNIDKTVGLTVKLEAGCTSEESCLVDIKN
jgi:hypothetical protein